MVLIFFFFQAEDGIRDVAVTGVQTLLFRSHSCRWREKGGGVNHLLVSWSEFTDLGGVRGRGAFGPKSRKKSVSIRRSFAEDARLLGKDRRGGRGRASSIRRRGRRGFSGPRRRDGDRHQ